MFTDKAVFDDMYKKGTHPMNKTELIEALEVCSAILQALSIREGILEETFIFSDSQHVEISINQALDLADAALKAEQSNG